MSRSNVVKRLCLRLGDTIMMSMAKRRTCQARDGDTQTQTQGSANPRREQQSYSYMLTEQNREVLSATARLRKTEQRYGTINSPQVTHLSRHLDRTFPTCRSLHLSRIAAASVT